MRAGIQHEVSHDAKNIVTTFSAHTAGKSRCLPVILLLGYEWDNNKMISMVLPLDRKRP